MAGSREIIPRIAGRGAAAGGPGRARGRALDAAQLLAAAQARRGLHRQALAGYERALAIRPDHPEALYGRGNTLYALGRFKEAVASYDRVLAMRPNTARALNNRGNA